MERKNPAVYIEYQANTVIPRYNVDFGTSQNSMLYQNRCYVEVYLKYKEKNRICK